MATTTGALRLHGVLLAVTTGLLGSAAASARAETAYPLTVSGTLTIAGGGTNEYTRKFSDVRVEAGTQDLTIQLSPAHDTLVIRGDTPFGGACQQGAQCWDSDICADGVCGWSGTEVAASCGDPQQLRTLDGNLDQCVRLWAVANPSALVSGARTCMEQVGTRLYGAGAVVNASCPQLAAYRNAYDLLFTGGPTGENNLLNKAIRKGVTVSLAESTASSSREAERIAEIKGVLAVIDAWFRAEVARRGTASDPALVSATSRTVGLLFKSLFVDEAVAGRATPSSASTAAQLVDEIQRSGLAADRQVLLAAYGPERPLQTAPLLLVTADALQGLADRTSSFASLQDIACRFRTCLPGRTSIGNYMTMLGSVAKAGAELRAASDLAKTSPRNGEPDVRALEWTPVFDLMSAQHAALENATLSARDRSDGYTPATLESDELDAIPRYAVPLATIVRPALAMATAFKSTGTFRPRPRQLSIGLDASRSERMRTEVERLCRSTDGVIPAGVRTYQANEREYVVSALDAVRSRFAADKATAQLGALLTRYGELSSDMKGLRATRLAEEIAFGGFMSNFEKLAPSIAADRQRIEVGKATDDIDVAATHARFDPATGAADVLQVAVQRPDGSPWKIASEPGAILNFGVTGSWAPTCALRRLKDPNQEPIGGTGGSDGDVLTGPEGYSVTRTGQHTKAWSESLAAGAEAWVSARLTSEACVKAGINFFGSGADVKSCTSFEIGARASTSWQTANSTSGSSLNSFSWGQGIRSGETPFPGEPVGSLLLVELPAGMTALSNVRSVQALTYPQASVVVGRSSDFYLVVNDLRCTPVSARTLGIRVSQLRSQEALSRALAQAMAEAQTELRSKAAEYVAQGRLLPEQRELLRSVARKKVYERAGVTSLAVYAESLRNLFDTFVNRELANIEREIELVSIERQIKALEAEEQAIRLDIASTDASGRVASLLGALSVRNLDLVQLESQTSQVSNLVRDWMDPVVALRLGADLQFTSNDKLLLDRLVALSPGGKYIDNLQLACPAVNMLTDKLASDANANPVPVVRTVIISIPNPSYTDSKPAYRETDPATSARIWASIASGGDMDLTVTPSMFYEDREPFSLQCQLNSPVVRSMAYYLVTGPLAAVAPLNSETTIVFPDMLFPRGNQLYGYTFMNGRYLSPQVTILTGNDPSRSVIDQVIGNGGSYWSTPEATTLTSRGTSPFTTYHLSLARARNTYTLRDGTLAASYPFKDAAALLVAFEVEAISQAPSSVLPGVGVCGSAATP